MSPRSRVLHDLTRVAGGAVSTAVGVKDELEALVRNRLERLVQNLDLATRDELEALRDVAVRAREEQERLVERVAHLEAQLAAKTAEPDRKTRGGRTASTTRPRRPRRTTP